jgi:hypothetical protein
VRDKSLILNYNFLIRSCPYQHIYQQDKVVTTLARLRLLGTRSGRSCTAALFVGISPSVRGGPGRQHRCRKPSLAFTTSTTSARFYMANFSVSLWNFLTLGALAGERDEIKS